MSILDEDKMFGVTHGVKIAFERVPHADLTAVHICALNIEL